MVLTLKNRHEAAYRGMYDGREYVIDGHGTLTVTEYVARHLRQHSRISWNPITGAEEFRLAIVEDEPDATPLTEIPAEVLDRNDLEPRMRHVKIVPSGIRASRPDAPRSE